MKKILLLVLILTTAAGYWWHRAEIASENEIELMPITSKPDPSNAIFEFEDGPVTLKDGKASTSLAPDSAISIETELADTLTYGDVNGDSKNDTVVLLIQNSGGSGIFVYVAAYVSGNVGYKGSNAVFIGDRISPQSVSVNLNGVITVEYLDRREGDPMAEEPTQPRTKAFVYKDGQLEER